MTTLVPDELTAEELDRLEEIARKATPGPWESDAYHDGDAEYGSGPDCGMGFDTRVLLDRDGRQLAFGAYDRAEVHEEYDEDGKYAWDETARRNFAYISAFDPPTALKLLAAAKAARPITMQDVRLRAGEGKLDAATVLAACNAELAARARLV